MKTLLMAGAMTLAFFLPAAAQDHMRGAHPDLSTPEAREHDPYRRASSQTGANCCHGADCAPYYGPAPKKVQQNGVDGWIVGRWFFEDYKRIKEETLPPDLRWEAHICIGEAGNVDAAGKHEYETPYCFYYPVNG